MRPLRLEMRGFAAFRDAVEVDFADADLVAFVGPTGAGKSTIIDAMTFALYGSVVRYDDRGAVAPAVNQLSNEARVLLDFEVAGSTYRAVRVVRRTPTGATTKEARLEHGSEILAGRASEMGAAVEALVGLDFDRFTRTVVLPQGRFAAFLHDRAADRQELLKQLLDLGIYGRIGIIARQRAQTGRDQLAVLEPRLAADVPTPEQIEILAERANGVATATTEVAGLLAGAVRADARSRELADEAEAMGVLALAAAGVHVPDEVGGLDAERVSATAAADAAATAVTACRADLAEAEHALAEGPDATACRQLLKDHAAQGVAAGAVVDTIERLETARTLLGEASRRADAVRAAQAEAAQRLADARDRVARARSAVATAPDAAALGRVRALRSELADAIAGARRIELGLVAAAVEAEAADALVTETSAALEQATELLGRVRAAKGAEGLVATLVAGEPCPVCRQTVTTLPDHDLDAELAAAGAAHDAARDAATSAGRAAQLARRSVDLAEAEQRRLSDLIESLTAALVEAPDDDRIEALLAEAEAARREAETADEAAASAERDDNAGRADPVAAAAIAGEQEARDRVVALESELEQRRRHLDDLEDSLREAPEPAALEAEIRRAEQLGAAVRAAREQLTDAEQAAARATEALDDIVVREREWQRALASTRDPLVVVGAPALGGSLAADWDALAGWAADLVPGLVEAHERGRRDAAELASEAADAITKARAVASEWLDVVPDDDSLAAAMATEQGRAESAVEIAEQRRREYASALDEVETLREQVAVDAELGRLLRAEGFERWLMEEALDDLVARATGRLLELSGGQYSLVARGGDFAICDHRNADELRDARTLSGGETFLASLALALGLAESLVELAPEGAPGLGSLFLDEGFGTLDPETLDVVAAAIEELGASGRMVAIVTHIRELAERMPVRFEVTKGPTSSTVRRLEV